MGITGTVRYDLGDATDFRLLADYRPPAWLDKAVFYQIFPERFANGGPTLDPQPEEIDYQGAHILFAMAFYG